MTERKSGKDVFYKAGVAIHGNEAGKCERRLQTIRGLVPNHNAYRRLGMGFRKVRGRRREKHERECVGGSKR